MRKISHTGDYNKRKIVRMNLRIFRKKSDCIVFAILAAIFGYFAFFHDVMELGDSFQYLNQMVSREPVYALLLKLLTGIFGENYGFPLVFVQNVLALVSTYWLYIRLTDLFRLPKLFEWAALAFLLAPHVITPIAARSGMIITNSVMTEGITVSLYYVWMGMMLTILLGQYGKKETKAMILSGVLAWILTMTRGQFLVCIAGWLLVNGFVLLIKKDYKKILFLLVGVLVMMGAKSYLTKAYHLAESDLFVATTSGQPMMLANILYLSDTEDGADIEDERLRQAYENMVRLVDEAQLSIRYGKGGIIEMAQFHEYGHEPINFDIIDPEIEAVVGEVNGVTSQDYEYLLYLIDGYASEIIGAVLPNILPEFVQNYFVIASLGFVRSIAVDRSVLPLYALLMYIVAIALAAVLLKRDLKSSSAYFMMFTLILICGNVFGTSIMIECISRYMIYNLPFFYIAGMAMLTELWKRKKGIKEDGI